MTTNIITRPTQKIGHLYLAEAKALVHIFAWYSFQSGLEAQHQCIKTLDFVPTGFLHNLLLKSFLENHQKSDMKSL